MHIKHCLNNVKAIAIQETLHMHYVDAAASDAENLCKWCLAGLVDIVWKVLFQNILNDSARRLQYATHVLFSQSTVEKEVFIRVIEICRKSGMLIKSCRYWLLKWQP